jgi:release factor glutamine methyltransferase
MIVAAALREAVFRLKGVTDTPQFDAALIVSHALGIDRSRLLVERDAEIDDSKRELLDTMLLEREQGKPIAYLLGTAGFVGREFEVNPDVLIPRPETEHMVEAALADLRSRPADRRRVVDIGTGSGAIAITIAADGEGANVSATDISEAALAIARRNAARFGVQIEFIAGDLAAPLIDRPPFDIVIANLPYVPTEEVPVAPNSVSYEPRVAVDGGADGLTLYRRLLKDAARITRAGSLVLLEAAPPTIESLSQLVTEALPSSHVEIGEDYAGMERYVRAIV